MTKSASAERSVRKKSRTPLACKRCRLKREKCSGDKPKCKLCLECDAICEWPAGRRPRRTKLQLANDAAREARGSLSPTPFDAAATTNAESPSSSPLQSNGNSIFSPVFAQQADADHPMTAPSYFSLEALPSFTPALAQPCPRSTGYSLVETSPSVLPTTPESDVKSWPIDFDASQLHTAPCSPDEEAQELFYYRHEGVTAGKQQGQRRIPLILAPKGTPTPAIAFTRDSGSGYSSPESTSLISKDPSNHLFDHDDGSPLPHIYMPLIDLFFSHMSQFFPSNVARRLKQRLETGTVSAFVLNAICALSARFLDTRAQNASSICAPFCARAQECVMGLLHFPTDDCVFGLMCLAWANYGQNSESGAWQFAGMAIRMAIGLGHHTGDAVCESDAHSTRIRMLFWSLYNLDRILSFSHGKATMIEDSCIRIPLPEDADLFPSATCTEAEAALAVVTSKPEPSPFVYLTQILVIAGRITNRLNTRHGVCTLGESSVKGSLQSLQIELIQFCRALPKRLAWSAERLKEAHEAGQSGVFLALHLWMNACLAFVYDQSQQCEDCLTPNERLATDSKVALLSARAVSDGVEVAKLFADGAINRSPHIVQPIVIASRVLMHQIECIGRLQTAKQRTDASQKDCRTILIHDLINLYNALACIEETWAGCSHHRIEIGQQLRALGVDVPQTAGKIALISLRDKGLRKRYSGMPLAFDTQAPTRKIRFEEGATYQSVEELLKRYTTTVPALLSDEDKEKYGLHA